MAIAYDETLRNDRLDAVRDAIDAGTGAGTIKIYDGTRPSTGGTATTLLTTGTFSDPSASNASGGELTFSSISYTDAVADGTATWARVEDSDGNFVADMDVGADGSGAEVELNSTSLVTGGPVSHVSAKITAGNA